MEVFGAGHAARRNAAALKRLAARMPVVFASRTGAGELYTSTAGYPGSEKDLIDGGLIPAGGLDGLKARVLLALLLADGAGRDRIAAALAQTVRLAGPPARPGPPPPPARPRPAGPRGSPGAT